MADTAFQKQYREEAIMAFEQGTSLLVATTTMEFVRKGNEAVFLVAGSNGAEPVTRGVDGLIPARADDLNQYTATLVEWHDLVRRSDFSIFASQGDGRSIMQQTTLKVMNRKRDADILSELGNATLDTGASQKASVALVARAKTILGNNEVPIEEEDNMFGVISPAFEAYMMQTKEFANAQYVDVKPFEGPARRYRRWYGINWIIHPNVSGVGTSTEDCFIYHRSAIGHAADIRGMNVDAGMHREHNYAWARTSLYMGSKLLQNSGVVNLNHDGSEYVAE